MVSWDVHMTKKAFLFENRLRNECQNYHLSNKLMSGSSLIGIQRVLIGVKYRNYCCTLDVYLLFAIWMGQIAYNLWTGQFISYRSVI